MGHIDPPPLDLGSPPSALSADVAGSRFSTTALSTVRARLLRWTGLVSPPLKSAISLVLWWSITVCHLALAIKPHSGDVLLIKNLIWTHEESQSGCGRGGVGGGVQRQRLVTRFARIPHLCWYAWVIKLSNRSGEVNQVNICAMATSPIE